ncbi:MAG: hypothetical protein JO121_05300 [Deltaproteobacteria bacterium]|nr:hypothetical protein [Deltaproteobacteria bacterium]
MSDPKYSMLLSESLLMRQTPALNNFSIPGLDPARLSSAQSPTPGHSQLTRINGRIVYAYPWGTSVLSLPFVAALNALGLSAARRDGSYNQTGEIWIQKIIACLLMSVTTCLFFRTAVLLLPISWSVVLAAAGALSTQIWSTATRALWSHTWDVFLGSWVIFILLSVEERRSRLRATLLATLVSWMYIVRPTSALDVIAISIFMFMFYRDKFLVWTGTGVFWLIIFCIYSLWAFGTIFPIYNQLFHFFRVRNCLTALAGILISPSRGLILFVPPITMVVFLVAFHWRYLPHRRLGVLAIAVVLAEIFMVSAWPWWWGGWSFGPRLLTDTVPWLMLLAILGCAALLKYCAADGSTMTHATYKNSLVSLGLFLICVGIAINGIGAISREAGSWNEQEDIDAHPERVWDWHHPQFFSKISREDWTPHRFDAPERRDSPAAGASPVTK